MSGSPASMKHEDNDDGTMKNHASADEDAMAYNNMVSSSVDITDAYVRNGILTVTRSARDFDTNSRRTFLYNVPFPHCSPNSLPPPVEVSTKIKCRIPSPSGKKLALLVEESIPTSADDTNNSNKKKRQVFEIWTNQGQSLSNRIVLPEQRHGTVCAETSGWFGSISWNMEESALVYCAEMKGPKTSSYFEPKKNGEEKDEDGNERRSFSGGQFTLGLGKGEHWGEKYTKTSRLAVFCLNVHSGKVGSVENVPGGGGMSKTTTTEGGYTLGQPIFSPDGTHIVYTGWDAGGGNDMPKRLGSIYCYQRPCKIYASPVRKLLEGLAPSSSSGVEDDGGGGGDDKTEEEKDKDGAYTCLTPDDRLARSPRFSDRPSPSSPSSIWGDEPSSPETAKLAYLCSTSGFDTHNGCMGLHLLDWNLTDNTPILESRRVLVKEVKLPSEEEETVLGGGTSSEKVGGLSFPGLFVDQLPKSRCFTPDGRFILATTQWGSVETIVRISTVDGSVVPVKFRLSGEEVVGDGDDFASHRLLCLTDDGGAIVTESEPNCPAVVGYVFPEFLKEEDEVAKATVMAKMSPIALTSFSSVGDVADNNGGLNFTYQVLTMHPPHGDVKVPIQGILTLPKIQSSKKEEGVEEEKVIPSSPLIVVPHGGPHSCSTTSYMPSTAYLTSRGYAILYVNFRGSTGFGQDAIESLPGNCGTLDVNDVVFATRTVLQSNNYNLDPQRVGICGGSHGGFLSAHCIGQHPDLFRVAAMRNPVTNVATMVTPTDIPDWPYVETYGVGYYNWAQFRGPSREELAKMWDCSPIAHVDNVVAPTLVALGMSDYRVPPSQGMEYYHTLRSKGVKTKLLVYDADDHAIDGVGSEADHWLNVKRWFDEHL